MILRCLFFIPAAMVLFSHPAVAQIDWGATGMVDIETLDTTVVVKMIYATPDNFTGQTLYKEIQRAYLRPEVAQKLISAQRLLSQEHPGYRLIVFDAARPMSVQRQMWECVRKTPQRHYVANPTKGGGLHNFGAAVDLSILDSQGNELPMGSTFDHFGPESHTTHEETLVAQGKITREELNNRLLLRRIMVEAGFLTIPNEWWHFNAYRRDYAQKHLPLLP